MSARSRGGHRAITARLTAIDRFLPPFRGCVIVFGVDQEVADPDFSATREVVDGRVVVTVTGEVDMSTAGDM
jgi:hypothetical protein